MEQFKRAKVVMLPTLEKSDIVLHSKRNKLYSILKDNISYNYNKILSPLEWSKQHLYITSDDKIKVGDWVINKWNEIHQITKNDGKEYIKTCKKIIATTNIKLGTCEYSDRYRESYFNPLPQPSQQFIEKYIEEYNKGTVITDILVEYEGEALYTEQQYFKGYKDNLKINPKDNTITIKKVKEAYTKDELCQVLENLTFFIWKEVGIHYPVSLGIDAKDKFINSEL